MSYSCLGALLLAHTHTLLHTVVKNRFTHARSAGSIMEPETPRLGCVLFIATPLSPHMTTVTPHTLLHYC